MLRAHDPTPRLVEQAVLARQHDHRRGFERLVIFDKRTGLVAIETRHHNVDKNQVGAVIRDQRQSLETIGCRYHLTTRLLQQVFGRSTNRLAVVDNHDFQPGESDLAAFVAHITS